MYRTHKLRPLLADENGISWEGKYDEHGNRSIQSIKIVNSFNNFSRKNLYLENDLTNQPNEVEIEC